MANRHIDRKTIERWRREDARRGAVRAAVTLAVAVALTLLIFATLYLLASWG